MTQALTRIKTSTAAAKLRLSDAFKNEGGAFDLPSVIVGVVVVAILMVGVLASIFGVIPFAQDHGAKQDLGAITTAQGVYKAQITEGGSYATDLAAIKAKDLIGQDVNSIAVAGSAGEWAATSKSGSGKFYVVTSKNTSAVEVSGVSDLQGALDSVWQPAVADNPATAGVDESKPAGLK